jgi:hypothetical protein
MTLPFRRRHNDAEASHDRARSIIANGFLESTDPADDAWLETHLEGCADCSAELHGYAADRELLRGLRSTLPEPPRDLWARTAASIERDGGRRDRAGRAAHAGPRIGRVPIGVLSGVLVVLVVVATSLFPPNGLTPIEPTAAGASDVAVVTPEPEVTPLPVTARLSWVEERSDGTFQLVFADVDEVCTSNPEACAPIEDTSTTRLILEDEPESVLLAPDSGQLVVVTKAAASGGGGEVIIVPVTTPEPSLAPGETPVPTVTPDPTPTILPSATPTLGPGETPGLPTPTPPADGSMSILSGVVVVGEAAYSADGQWLAFSARPIDGTSGPDLYTWHVGAEPQATAVTSDHRTFFAGWLGNLILASRVETTVPDEPTASPDASALPSAAPATTAKPGKTPHPATTPSPAAPSPAAPSGSAGPSASAGASPDVTAPPAEDHPISFLLDPATSPATVIDLAGQDIWRPVVNTTSRTIVYWSGTLVPDAAGTGWELGTGRLVLDAWIDPAVDGAASPDPGATFGPTATAGPTATPRSTPTLAPGTSLDPLASAVPTPPPGPAGSPVVLAEGLVSDFDISFDPTGTRLAVWIRDPENANVGTLRLVAIDPVTGAINPALDPLPAATALRGFSIDEGRLAWVTPPGQDGESSHVHVLAWTGDEFGQVRSVAADWLFVVR